MEKLTKGDPPKQHSQEPRTMTIKIISLRKAEPVWQDELTKDAFDCQGRDCT